MRLATHGRVFVLGAALLLGALPGPIAHAQRPHYALDMHVDTDARQLRGRARISLENTSATPFTSVFLWRYPQRFAKRARELNDFNFYWTYAHRSYPAKMSVAAIRVDGAMSLVEVVDHPQAGTGTLLRVRLPAPVAPGRRVTLELDYEIRLPARFGTFGCDRTTCTMSGGFYPML